MGHPFLPAGPHFPGRPTPPVASGPSRAAWPRVGARLCLRTAVSRSPLGELSCHCREVTKDGALAVPLFTGPRVLGDAVGRVGTVGEKHGGVVVDIRGMSHGKWGQQAPAF